jgi:hypothetical protein
MAKTVAFWVALIVTAILLYNVFAHPSNSKEQEILFSKFLEEVSNKNVKSVKVISDRDNSDVTGEYFSPPSTLFKTVVPTDYPALYDKLQSVPDVKIEHPTQSPWITALISWAPFLFIIGFWIFFMRQMQSGGNKALSFGKSRARLLTAHQKKVTFKDVAGVEEAKEELQEIIDFLKEPKNWADGFPKECCWLALREPARPFWHAPSPEKRMFRSSPLAARISLKCSWALVRRAFATSSSRVRKTPHALSLSMKSMRWDATAAPVSAAGMTSGNRH